MYIPYERSAGSTAVMCPLVLLIHLWRRPARIQSLIPDYRERSGSNLEFVDDDWFGIAGYRNYSGRGDSRAISSALLCCFAILPYVIKAN